MVRLVFEGAGDDGEPDIGEPQVVNAVYGRAPTVKIDAEIAELAKRRDEVRDALAATARDLAAAKAEDARRKTRMQQNAALDRVLDFMEGRFTHFVVESWTGFEIVERGKALEEDERLR